MLLLMQQASIVILSIFCIATIGFGADIRSIEVVRDGARYRLVSETHFDSRLQDVFSTLTDYDKLAGISRVIKDSHYLDSAEDGQKLVFTRLEACVLFYCKTVEKIERLEFDAPCRIVTNALPERSNVRFSRSEWSLTVEEGGGTNVVFQLEFEPDFWIPPIIGPLVIKNLLIEEGASAVQEIEAMAQQRRAVRPDVANQQSCNLAWLPSDPKATTAY